MEVLRKSVSAVAMIESCRDGQPVWLAQWNAKWEKLALVGGHKCPSETFREAIEREIREELGLRPDADFRIEDRPRRLKFVAWSESARRDTTYDMALFRVKLTAEAIEAVADNPANCWLDEDEIRNGRSRDGRLVSETVLRVLRKASSPFADISDFPTD